MAYEKTTWQNGKTAINASNMNHIEEGVKNNDLAIAEIKKEIITDSNPQTLSVSTASYTGSITYYKKNSIVCVSGKITTNFLATKITTDSNIVSESNKTILKLIATLPDEYVPPFGIHCHALADNKKSVHIYIANGNIRLERFGPGTTEITKDDAIWFSLIYPV